MTTVIIDIINQKALRLLEDLELLQLIRMRREKKMMLVTQTGSATKAQCKSSPLNR